jgi:5-methylcytosine-specific restriction endonuclease McrA
MLRNNRLARLVLAMENELFPALGFDAAERVLYYFLFARTHVRGRRRVRLPLHQIARGTQLSWYLVGARAKQLRAKGCLRSYDSTRSGTMWEVLLPREVLGAARKGTQQRPSALDALDCFIDRRARGGILRRERGYCFYCLRRNTNTTAVLDHVVARARGGDNSYRNIVACCKECNVRKGTFRAANYLRRLFRSGRLNSTELSERLTALARLTRGCLKIKLAA